MIEYTLLNVLILELKIYGGPGTLYERSKFGQYDEVKNRAPYQEFPSQRLTHLYIIIDNSKDLLIASETITAFLSRPTEVSLAIHVKLEKVQKREILCKNNSMTFTLSINIWIPAEILNMMRYSLLIMA